MSKFTNTLLATAASRIGRSAFIKPCKQLSVSIGSVRAYSDEIFMLTLVRAIGPKWSRSS